MKITGSITIFDRNQNHAEQEDIAALHRLVWVDASGLHVGESNSHSEVLIDDDSIAMRVNNETFSTYGIDHSDLGSYRIGYASDGGLCFDYIAGGV